MNGQHDHRGTASNTRGAIMTFIGCQVKGLLESALPLSRRDLAAGNKTIVFTCGWGLTFNRNGAYWVDSTDDIQVAIARLQREYADTTGRLEELFTLAGEA